MTASDLGRAKTPAVAPHVEISLSNCISESQIILHTRGSMPCWRIVFSTFRGCMSFYTARVSSSLGNNCRRGPYQRLVVIGQPDYDSFGGRPSLDRRAVTRHQMTPSDRREPGLQISAGIQTR